MTANERRNGFALTEILLAIGIIGFALVSLLALIALGVETNRISAEESGAVNLASSILSDLRNSPVTDGSGNLATTSVGFQLPMPLSVASTVTPTPLNLDVNGSEYAAGAETHYLVTLVYTPSGSYKTDPDRKPAYVSLTVTWPGNAPTDKAIKGRWHCVAAFPEEVAAWK